MMLFFLAGDSKGSASTLSVVSAAEARFLFIYFHANAEDLGLSYGFCRMLRNLGPGGLKGQGQATHKKLIFKARKK